MSIDLLRQILERSRKKTVELMDAIAARPNPSAALAWRPGPSRAHIAWQLMHIAATEDRHVHVRMKGGEAKDAELVRRFAGGSVPDDDIPALDAIRRYLEDRRRELLGLIATLSEADLPNKPNPQAPWAYGEWLQVLAWHEAHHHGQAHLTYNLYRAAHDPTAPKVGH
jgi:hypothetical protein